MHAGWVCVCHFSILSMSPVMSCHGPGLHVMQTYWADDANLLSGHPVHAYAVLRKVCQPLYEQSITGSTRALCAHHWQTALKDGRSKNGEQNPQRTGMNIMPQVSLGMRWQLLYPFDSSRSLHSSSARAVFSPVAIFLFATALSHSQHCGPSVCKWKQLLWLQSAGTYRRNT